MLVASISAFDSTETLAARFAVTHNRRSAATAAVGAWLINAWRARAAWVARPRGPSYRADCGRSVIRGGGAGVYGTHDLLSTSLSNSWSM
jgi:hypothetical protein